MPTAMKTRCPVCSRLGCTACLERKRQQRADRLRESSHKRGYDAMWRRNRKLFLARNTDCMDCMKTGRLTPATEVHHVVKLKDAPQLQYVEGNLMALCHECHSKRTARGE